MRNWYYFPDAPSTDPDATMPETLAGTYEEYDNHLRFVSVNGVGHMVENYKFSILQIIRFLCGIERLHWKWFKDLLIGGHYQILENPLSPHPHLSDLNIFENL